MPVSVSTTRTVSRPSMRTRSCAPVTPRCCHLRRRADAARSRPSGRWPRRKLGDAETIEDALVWLKPKERMVVMKDPAMLERLVQLKPTAAGMANAAE